MSAKYEAEGSAIKIGDTQTFDSGFQKREIVLDIPDGKYSEQVQFEVIKDNVKLLDGLTVGDSVKVSFNLKGREYNGRYFVNLQAWKVERTGGAGKQSGEDDIPF